MQLLQRQQSSVRLHGQPSPMPSETRNMSLTADRFGAIVADINASSFATEAERAKARIVARQLLDRIQTPWETTFNTVWAQPALGAAIKACVDICLFDKWEAAGGRPSSVAQLAELTDSDERLLLRLLSHLVATNTLDIAEDGKYARTPLVVALGDPETGFASCYSYMFDINMPGFGNLPSFLAKQSHADPADPVHSNWQDLHGNPQPAFEYIGGDARRAADFQQSMKAYGANKLALPDVYPTAELVAAADPTRPVLVDVGGGAGHDVSRFLAHHPDLHAGALVLQDLPHVVAGLSLDARISVQAHDFFAPQPVRGAKAYYMHIVAHDWPDVQAEPLLRAVATAMTPGYSVLLLHEVVVDVRAPHEVATGSDLTMMMAFSARERTEDMWRELVEKAGLRVRRIVKGGGHESIIEIETA